MNDFTKEELKFIFEHTKFSIDYNKVINAPMTILTDKLQSMIDKYCEHEKVVPNYDCKTQCDKCGKIL